MNKYQIGYGRLAEDEDMIVGTKEGLESLIKACEEALKEGQSKTHKECEIYAVKQVGSEYFKKEEKEDGLINKIIIFVFLGLFFSSIIIGFITIVKWSFSFLS